MTRSIASSSENERLLTKRKNRAKVLRATDPCRGALKHVTELTRLLDPASSALEMGTDLVMNTCTCK